MSWLFNKQFLDRTALKYAGNQMTFKQLWQRATAASLQMPQQEIIPLHCQPDEQFIIGLLAAWIKGSVACPLNPMASDQEMQYYLQDTQASYVYIGSSQAVSQQIKEPVGTEEALIIYTSGTTSKPKGVVHTHQSLKAQVESLSQAWKWSMQDHILNVLPLYHVHGLVNVVLCSLYNGACLELLEKNGRYGFDADAFWDRILNGSQLTLFMAVPTIYYKLVESFNKQPRDRQEAIQQNLQKFRLFVSGSSALPLRTLEQWENISQNQMLERYGMTEIGMALSQPLDGIRQPGTVGTPLPGVDARLVDENGKLADEGDLQIKSKNMCKVYLNKPEQYQKEFTKDGWFKTGDVASKSQDVYKILGRSSQDIIKTRGYKVSALEIERVLLELPGVKEACVFGVEDAQYGQTIKALVVTGLEEQHVLRHAREKLSSYKVPSILQRVDNIPKNAMGKVNKKRL